MMPLKNFIVWNYLVASASAVAVHFLVAGKLQFYGQQITDCSQINVYV